ncbi:MAG TPA: (4Fe-4S)-binding protein [Gemmatimonadales bacterium]|nr:(4Fe-4S)-binding protein [Gemmatimonadales bacterium]
MTDRLQVYESDTVRVTFDPRICIHSGICLRTLPAVFDISRRRWIDPKRASADEGIAAVAKCPSGALQATRLAADGSAQPVGATDGQEEPAVTITVREHGPYAVEGPFKVVDAAGNELRQGVKCTLCRCGRTGTPPFCDSTHKTIEW